MPQAMRRRSRSKKALPTRFEFVPSSTSLPPGRIPLSFGPSPFGRRALFPRVTVGSLHLEVKASLCATRRRLISGPRSFSYLPRQRSVVETSALITAE